MTSRSHQREAATVPCALRLECGHVCDRVTAVVVCVVESMCHVWKGVTARCSVATTALSGAPRTARRARKTVATTASTASAKRKCGDPCDPCNETCIWRCQHHRCHEIVRETVRSPSMQRACTKLLPCRHPCIGPLRRTMPEEMPRVSQGRSDGDFSPEPKTSLKQDSWNWQTVVTCLRLK
ncbi:NFX1-type zinc finger-containing protein 1 [Desmophyllum pertusum]|uniref:NFX1-type zinc finger-containing protein 1 n=1 Tax=Desmophyllum pertusum TaxID=174260 RepID=A0A9W9YC62_9CNID|nr:NFX1-type zinc finger-containing protein 1 [Desmophyllum pertusum]